MAYGALYDPSDPQSLVQQYSSLYTIGERNNNYGNLRSNDPFVGKIGSRGSYDLYDTPENGLRALARDLNTKATQRGIDTVGSLIDRYAPLSDNPNNPQYKDYVAKALGVGINDSIDLSNMRPQVMDAIIRFENNGRPLASPMMIRNAIAAADGTPTPEQPDTQGNQEMVELDNNQLKTVIDTINSGAAGPLAINGIIQQFGTHPLVKSALVAKGLIGQDRAYPDAILRQTDQPSPATGVLAQGAANDMMQATSDFGSGLTAAQRGAVAGMGVLETADGTTAVVPATVTAGSGGRVMRRAGGSTVNPPSAAPVAPKAPYEYLPPAREVQASSVDQAVSGKRRDQSPMSFDPAIDMNEALIRIGLAGVGGSSKGALNALDQMGQTYGAIQDANRSNALAAYEAELAAMKGDASGVSDDDMALADRIESTLFNMDEAMGFLERAKSGEGGGLTGWLDGTLGEAWDNLRGNPEATGRRLLSQLRVDDALIRVAQTKGAISNHEMKLFLDPAPNKYMDEQVWIDWINVRRKAAERILNRLRKGKRVASGEQATEKQVNEFSSSNTSSEIDDLVSQYAS